MNIQNFQHIHLHVPEVLNVYMNAIYKKLTAIKSNKLKLKKVLNKSHFLSKKFIFHCFKKKIFFKKVDFYSIFVHMNVQNFRHIHLCTWSSERSYEWNLPKTNYS